MGPGKFLAGAAGAAYNTVQRYGCANKEFVVVYAGADNDNSAN